MVFLVYLLPLVTAADSPPAAAHATIDTQFIYLGSTRTSSIEYWTTADMTRESRSGNTRIIRHDLGVVWTVFAKLSGYREEKLREQPDAEPETIYNRGFNYQPKFQWQVAETGESRTIAGRMCRLSAARGIAEYAETNLRLWLCEAKDAAAERRLSELAARTLGGQYGDIAEFARETAIKHEGRVLLAAEETTEPPIAPVMVRKTEVRSLENAAAPPDAFEVPSGYKKLEAR